VGADVGAGRAHAAEDFLHRGLDRAAAVEQHFLAFAGAVVGDAAGMPVHRRARTHAVEAHLALAVLFDHFAHAFVVAGEHAAEHDEIGAAAEGLGQVAGRGAAAVGADQPAQAVGRVGAFDDGRKLRVADAGHLARGAYGTGADADLDDVGAVEDQFLGHFAGDHIAGHEGNARIGAAQLVQEIDKGLGVAVGDVDADAGDGIARHLLDAAELVVVLARDAHRVEHGGVVGQAAEECRQRGLVVVFVQGRGEAVAGQRPRHFEGADGVHVGGNDRHALVAPARVAKDEFARDVDFGTRGQRRALGADQDILKVQLEVFFDAHGECGVGGGPATRNQKSSILLSSLRSGVKPLRSLSRKASSSSSLRQ
jgi:hypothetical protein